MKDSLNPLFVGKEVPKNIFVEGLYYQKGSTDENVRCKLVGFVITGERVGTKVKITYNKKGDVADSIIAELGVEIDLPREEGSH